MGPSRPRLAMQTAALLALLAAALAPTGELAAQTAAPPEESTRLDVLVAGAIEDYPSILAEWAEVEQLEAREEQVSQPFDPMLSFGVMNVPLDSFSFTEHGMTGLSLGVSERFYWPGVLDARADEARARAAARAARIPETAVRIWLMAVMPYTRIIELDRALAVLEARREVLEYLRDAARARYEARVVPLTDVLRVDTEISRVDQELAAVRSGRRVAVADLNGLLNRPSTEPIVVATPAEPVAAEGDADVYLARTLENRPAFAGFAAEERHVGAQRGAAEADDDPVWSVGVAYVLRLQDPPMDSDLVSLNLGISLPFFSANRTDARLEELAAREAEIEFDRQELVRQLRADIGSHLEAMASLEDEIAVIDDELIPAVESSYEGAMAHFVSSHVAVETLIEIQDRLLELELSRSRLVSAHDLYRARLQALTADSDAMRRHLRSDP